MSPTHTVRLLIADRRPIAASGLRVALEETGEFTVAASCPGVRELSRVLLGGGIDVVVIDAEMFGGDAVRAVEAIRALQPAVAVLVLATQVDERLLEAIAREQVACASVYSDGNAFLSTCRALLGGETLLPPEVQQALMRRVRRPPPALRPPLTSREQQVLELAATGLTVSQIATDLHISHSTAKTHLLRVYEKLEAPNRSAAVATAVARGLLHISPAAA